MFNRRTPRPIDPRKLAQAEAEIAESDLPPHVKREAVRMLRVIADPKADQPERVTASMANQPRLNILETARRIAKFHGRILRRGERRMNELDKEAFERLVEQAAREHE